MKKIFVFVCLAFIAFNANAQLNVKNVVKEKPQKIMTLQATYSYLYKMSFGYVILMGTDNKFDKNSVIELGETKENVLQTLNDLKEIINNKISMVSVEQTTFDITLSYSTRIGTDILLVKQSGNGGKSWISINHINKIIEYFENEVI